ncbi:MAG: hypothetical protein KatS3mg114_0223 [Planctomycetaceae bacterium]|nr:MAG: hypothetical protein KatS3mg114_0223 [Planctomycetaceae bacterium]
MKTKLSLSNPHNLYIRDLFATRSGEINPCDLVADWMERFLEAVGYRQTEQGAYELVTQLGRLQRTRVSLIEQAPQAAVYRGHLAQIEAELLQLIIRALRFIDAPEKWKQEWLKQAQTLLDDSVEADQYLFRQKASILLEQLDDFELVIALAQNYDVSVNEELREAVDECLIWLSDNPEAFYHASTEVQTLGATVRPNLPNEDIELAATAGKIIELLDALEEAEGWLPVIDAPEPVGAPSVSERMLSPTAGSVSWLPTFVPAYTLAADTETEVSLRRHRWTSPDGRYAAVWVVPSEMSVSEDMRVMVMHQQQPTRDLCGMVVRLCGVESTIKESFADFPSIEIKAAAERYPTPQFEVQSSDGTWVTWRYNHDDPNV